MSSVTQQVNETGSRKEARIPVMEIFGPTVQGEGMVIGQKRCLFVPPAAIIAAPGATRPLPGTVVARTRFE